MNNLLSIDTETYLIEPGLLAPPLVCLSFTSVEDDGTLNPPGLFDRQAGMDFVERLLVKSVEEHGDKAPQLIVHNAAFDMAVLVAERPHLLPLVVRAYDEGRVRCTKVRDAMLLNARGELKDEDSGKKTELTLAAVVQRRFGVDISDSKTDPNAWRLRYAELDGVPLQEWPEDAKTYAKDDATWHLATFLHQEQERAENTVTQMDGDTLVVCIDPLQDELGQTRAAFALHLMSMYGVTTDGSAVGALEEHLTQVVEEANARLLTAGILKQKKTTHRDKTVSVEVSKDTKTIQRLIEDAFLARGEAPPRTDPSTKFPDGQIKMDEETLRATGHPDLLVLADVSADNKLLTTYIPALKGLDSKGKQRGLPIPTGWLLQPGYNTMVSSGRTSAYSPNIQNPPRKGGVRECFVPRPGFWYCSVDYTHVELNTWAQTCLDLLGFSDLAEAIRNGMDPHVDMAVEILRSETPVRLLSYVDKTGARIHVASNDVTYDDVNIARKTEAWAKDARQLAKAANFGFPGGLGAASFVAFAHASYGVTITEQKARELKNIWRSKWREADAYFNYVSSLQGGAHGQEFTVVLPRTGFVRGGCTFTSGCNTYFQGLAARGAKEAMWLLLKACYVEEDSPLYGCRPVMFIHDEFIVEVPADPQRAHAASAELQRIMELGMNAFVPDVPVKTEPTLMERWYKEAGPVYQDGLLVPWKPKEVVS